MKKRCIMDFKTVFGPSTGGPSDYYRIPSMITTKNGVVVACADARCCSGMDNPNRIDKVVRRSTDSGNTWSEYIIAVKEHGKKQMRSSAAIDPVMTYDENNSRIYLHYSHTPAGVGIRNSRCTMGTDKDGNMVVRSFGRKFICRGGKLYTNGGKATAYTVDKDGNVSKNGCVCGNIYTGGRFKQEHTSYLMMCYSDDDGLTWSEPQILNHMVKRSDMSFIGPGPGCGITISQGKYKGRIVVPIYYGTRTFPLRLSCAVIYSDDCGKTWKMGKSPNNTRSIGSKVLSDTTIKNNEMLTESQLIEQEDGTLKYFIRNHDPRRSVAVAYSKNGGESWEDFRWDDNLPQAICQMSVIKLKGTENPTVIFLNPADKKKRVNGTVRISEDDGETFTNSRLLKGDGFVYSAMTQLPNGKIGVLFEPDSECREILFASFSTDWIRDESE